jgi:hypothetical protein
VGPILGATLALASTSGEVGHGIFLLTSYAAGLAVPFFLSALAINSFSILAEVAPLHTSDSYRGRRFVNHRRRFVDYRLHDFPQRLRAPLHTYLVAAKTVTARLI